LIPGDLLSDPERHAWTAAPGVESAFRLFRSEAPGAPLVLCLSALGVRAAYYQPLARELAASGFHALTADLRGLGESVVRPSRRCDFGYRELVEEDLPALFSAADRVLGPLPKIVLGHSLGGQLGLLHAGSHPGSTAAIALVAAGSVDYRGFPFPASMKILASVYAIRLVSMVLGYFPGGRLGFAGTEARSVMRDWAHNGLTGRFELAGSTFDYEAAMAQLRIPVLALSFEEDTYAPRGAAARLLAKARAATVTHWHLGARDLGVESIGHFDWVKQSGPVVGRLAPWMRGALSTFRPEGGHTAS
jgi:predicted alpha/beta hydrolase